jgi:hypothetical protein
MFHDPTGTGTDPGAPGVIPIGGGPVTVQLYYTAGSIPPIAGQECTGTVGNAVCGVDFLITTTGGVQILQDTWVPDGDWVVNNTSISQIRGNGGVFDVGAGYNGADRMGSFQIQAVSPGALQLVGVNYVYSGFQLLPMGSPPKDLMVAGGDDFDLDMIPDAGDSCPTVPNIGDSDLDGVDDACDNCRDLANPPWTGATTNRHRTGGGTGGLGQLDDDVDGRGNRCDFDYTQSAIAVGAPDTALMVAALGNPPLVPAKNISQNDCNPAGTTACGIFDNSESAAGIGAPDAALLTGILTAGTTSLNSAPLRHCGVTPAQTCSQDPNQACCSPFSRPIGSVPPPTLNKAVCLNATGAGAPQRCVYAN